MVSTTGKKIILGVVVAILAIIIGLVASSLKRLSTEEAGIKYNVVQRILDKSLYTAGITLTFTLLAVNIKIEN